VPGSRVAIIAALVARPPGDEIKRAVAQLGLVGHIDDRGGRKCSLTSPEAALG
jgi:hypothetical protein